MNNEIIFSIVALLISLASLFYSVYSAYKSADKAPTGKEKVRT